jgi:hypothetical protein
MFRPGAGQADGAGRRNTSGRPFGRLHRGLIQFQAGRISFGLTSPIVMEPSRLMQRDFAARCENPLLAHLEPARIATRHSISVLGQKHGGAIPGRAGKAFRHRTLRATPSFRGSHSQDVRLIYRAISREHSAPRLVESK